MEYFKDLTNLKKCQICGEKYEKSTGVGSLMKCLTCGSIFCNYHTTKLPGQRYQVSSHELMVEPDRELCPNGHETIEYVFPAIDLGTFFRPICELSSRHSSGPADQDVLPTCKAQSGEIVSRETWENYCVEGGRNCPQYVQAKRPWWKFW